MKQKFIKLFFLLIPCFLTFSCKKSKEEPVPETPKGSIELHLHNYIGASEVDGYGIVYETEEGRRIAMNEGQFYLYNFELISTQGNYLIKDATVLKVQDEYVYYLGEVPLGVYQSVAFTIGVDTTKGNKRSLYDHNEMYFNNKKGDEIGFFKFSGSIDTTASMDGVTLIPFSYLIGLKANERRVVMPQSRFSVQQIGTAFIHMYADYSRVFNGLNISQKENLLIQSQEQNRTSLSTKIADNLKTIFVYE